MEKTDSGSRTREKVLRHEPKSERVPVQKAEAEVPRTSQSEVREKIRELRRKEENHTITEREKRILEAYKHDLTQEYIMEDSGYGDITDEVRAYVLERILKETDPNASRVTDETLSFEKLLPKGDADRIHQAAGQILEAKPESRSKRIQEMLVDKFRREFRKTPDEVNGWIEAAKKKLRS